MNWVVEEATVIGSVLGINKVNAKISIGVVGYSLNSREPEFMERSRFDLSSNERESSPDFIFIASAVFNKPNIVVASTFKPIIVSRSEKSSAKAQNKNNR